MNSPGHGALSSLPVVGRIVGTLLLLFGLYAPIADNLSQSATIAVLFPGRVEYFSTQRAVMVRHADEIGVTLRFFYADWNSAQQQKQFDNAVQSGFPVVALCAVDPNLSLDAVENRSTKVLTFTNSVGTRRNGEHRFVRAHVGRDEVRSGQLLGEMVERVTKGNTVTIGLVEGHEGCPPQIARRAGFFEVLRRHPEWSVKWTHRIPGWRQQEFLKRVSRGDVDSVDVVVCQWATPADTIVETFGMMLPEIVTLESTDATLAHFANQKIAGATIVDIAQESKQVVQVGKQLWKGATVPAFVETKQELAE